MPPSLKKKYEIGNFLLRYSSTHWVLISYIFKKFHAAVNIRTNWLIDWLKDYVKNSIPLQLVAWVKITSWPIFHVQMLIHSFIIPHAQCKYSLTHWRSWKKSTNKSYDPPAYKRWWVIPRNATLRCLLDTMNGLIFIK